MPLYVPALKAKRGEFDAFSNLDDETSSDIFPIWEMPAHSGKKSHSDWLRERLSRLLTLVDERPQIDMQYFGPADEAWSLVREVVGDVGDNDHYVIPTFSSPSHLNEHSIELAQRAGAAVIRIPRRLLATGRDVSSDVYRMVDSLGLQLSDVRIVADFEAVDDDFVDVITRATLEFVDSASAYSGALSISVLVGAFPASLSNYHDEELTGIARLDWSIYQTLLADRPNAGIAFGDYAVAAPGMPAGGRTPTPSIRYTADVEWLIAKGRSADRNNSSQYHELAREVVNLPEFRTADFSWGDASIEAVATESRGPGNPTDWRAFATNHHLRFVAEQLASLPVA